MIIQIQRGCAARACWLVGILLTWWSLAPLAATEIELPLLKSGTDFFTNVTVYGQTETDLFIKHSRGFGNVKVTSLDNQTLQQLKLGGGTPETEPASVVLGTGPVTVATLKAKLAGLQLERPSDAEVREFISRYRPSPNVLTAVLAVAAIAYLLWCAALKLICLNAGSKPGRMIWLPVLQMLPLLRAANMSAWWFIAFLIPLLNVVAHIVWCFKIAKACGKSTLVAVLLILPVTNLLALLYLALSKGKSQPAEETVPMPRHSMVLGEA